MAHSLAEIRLDTRNAAWQGWLAAILVASLVLLGFVAGGIEATATDFMLDPNIAA